MLLNIEYKTQQTEMESQERVSKILYFQCTLIPNNLTRTTVIAPRCRLQVRIWRDNSGASKGENHMEAWYCTFNGSSRSVNIESLVRS